MDIKTFLTILQIIVACANICIMAFAFIKFLGRPHSNLDSRVTALEKRVKDLEEDLSETKKALQVIMHSVLALLEFEMQYCLTEHKDMSDGLKKAKEDLHSFLSDR